MKNQTKVLATLLTLSALNAPAMLLAQDDLLTESQTVLNAEQIDIDADYEEPEQPTAQEIIEQARQKSEMKNVKKIAKKIENLKVPTAQIKQITDQESVSLANKISNIFGAAQEQTQPAVQQAQPVAPVQTQTVVPAQDTVVVQQAAPVQTVMMAAPEVKKPVEMDSIRIIPNGGIMNIQGKDISLESKYSAGLALETMVHPHIAVGLGVGYSGLDIVDVEQAWANSTIGNYSELEYKQLDVRLNSKFFFIAEGKFRPYAGLGLSYSRVNMKYTGTSSEYNNSTWFFGQTAPQNNNLPIDEEFSAGFVSGNVSLGTEFKFTKNVGVMVEGSYAKSFTGSMAAKSVLKTEKQARLDVLGEQITDANIFALNAGLLVTF